MAKSLRSLSNSLVRIAESASEKSKPRNFSFNSPQGACPDCSGLGVKLGIRPELVVPNPRLSLDQGANCSLDERGAGEGYSWYAAQLDALADLYGFTTSQPYNTIDDDARHVIMYGLKGRQITVKYQARNGRTKAYQVPYEGVIPNLTRRFATTSSDYVKDELGKYMAANPCPTCNGTRLRREILSVLIDDKNIVDISRLPIRQAREWAERLALDPGTSSEAVLTPREYLIGRQVMKEVRERLGFLVDVGLDYLTMDRSANTLSGGEAQRIRLATQIGSALRGVLYILDDPSIGLHQRDNDRLIRTLLRLRDLGIPDRRRTRRGDDARRRLDLDIGPGAGVHGGEVVRKGASRSGAGFRS